MNDDHMRDHSHETDHDYHETEQGMRRIMFTQMITEAIIDLTQALHEVEPIPEGGRWTIPLHLDCGAIYDLSFYIQTKGSCASAYTSKDIDEVREGYVRHVEEHDPEAAAKAPKRSEIEKMAVEVQGEPDDAKD